MTSTKLARMRTLWEAYNALDNEEQTLIIPGTIYDIMPGKEARLADLKIERLAIMDELILLSSSPLV